MIHILLRGISILLTSLILNSCNENIKFSNIQIPKEINNQTDYALYCNIDFSANFESNSILCSFVGEYKKALEQSSKRPSSESNLMFEIDEAVIVELKKQISNENITIEKKFEIQQYLDWVGTLKNIDSVFQNYELQEAKSLILKQANFFHYLLINEAHYSAQHRAFTTELLEPLWNLGYRYLALEAMGYGDKEINSRSYPNIDSGYYIRETTFGNMIRQARKLGFKIISYETQSNADGTPRDYDQAINLFNQTLKVDKIGKVLVHAGYGHIAEIGDQTYMPMGSQLKEIINEDILTIDQQTMSESTDASKMNSYYRYAIDNYKFKEASVFISEKNKCLVDPINTYGIDIQIYHPKTDYIYGRPTWLKNDSNEYHLLSEEYLKYNGSLVEIKKANENIKSVPIDRFIIKKYQNAFISGDGVYEIKIYDQNGIQIGESQVIIEN